MATTAACSQTGLLSQQAAEVNALRAENAEIQRRLDVLQDSVRFFDDIDSGFYYRERRSMEDRIDQLQYNLAACAEGGHTLENLLVDDIFRPGSADISPAGEERLDRLADSIRTGLSGQKVRIEGHSDSTPIGGTLRERFPSNWELAASRAAAVVRFLVEEHDIPANQIEVASYGDTRPVASNNTAAGRRENRRIRVAVVSQ